MYRTLTSLSEPFTTSTIKSNFPYSDFWRNNPLSENSYIFPRQAGYMPYSTEVYRQTFDPYIDKCNVYQKACETILPVNTCYLKNKQYPVAP